MRTFETKIQELKTAVLTEVARLTWEDRLQTGTAILDIPEKIIPGPTATLRCCIYKGAGHHQQPGQAGYGRGQEQPLPGGGAAYRL